MEGIWRGMSAEKLIREKKSMKKREEYAEREVDGQGMT